MFVKEKNIEANGIISRKVATTPNLYGEWVRNHAHITMLPTGSLTLCMLRYVCPTILFFAGVAIALIESTFHEKLD